MMTFPWESQIRVTDRISQCGDKSASIFALTVWMNLDLGMDKYGNKREGVRIQWKFEVSQTFWRQQKQKRCKKSRRDGEGNLNIWKHNLNI